MWSRQFVEPEMAAWTKMAFSKLSIVTRSLGLMPSMEASFTARAPARRAYSTRSGLAAGSRALPGRARPRASAMICMVEAVPMKEQAPQPGQAFSFAQQSVSSPISPRSNLAAYMPSCSRVRSSGPAAMVPPVTTTEGMFTRARPIRFPGSPLSQLARKTPASKGVALAWISIILAIISRLAREKLMPSVPWLSPSHMSVQKYRAPWPPAWAAPSRTASTSLSRWPEPGWLSPKVLSMKIWGFARSSGVQPEPRRRGSSSGARLRMCWLVSMIRIVPFSWNWRLEAGRAFRGNPRGRAMLDGCIITYDIIRINTQFQQNCPGAFWQAMRPPEHPARKGISPGSGDNRAACRKRFGRRRILMIVGLCGTGKASPFAAPGFEGVAVKGRAWALTGFPVLSAQAA